MNFAGALKSIVTAGLCFYFVLTILYQIKSDITFHQTMSEIQDLQKHIDIVEAEHDIFIKNQICEMQTMRITDFSEDPIAQVITTEDSEEVVMSTVEPENVSIGFGDLAFSDMYTVQVNKSYNIPREFYYEILPESMYPLVESVCNLEQSSEISSMFLLAVAATEVGWGKSFFEQGSNNWFNWTADACNYQCFSSTEECVLYTGEKFQERFFNPDWYADFGQEISDSLFTVPEVNTRYALLDKDTVNWYWSDVVCEIMYSFNSKYQDWRVLNYDM